MLILGEKYAVPEYGSLLQVRWGPGPSGRKLFRRRDNESVQEMQTRIVEDITTNQVKEALRTRNPSLARPAYPHCALAVLEVRTAHRRHPLARRMCCPGTSPPSRPSQAQVSAHCKIGKASHPPRQQLRWQQQRAKPRRHARQVVAAHSGTQEGFLSQGSLVPRVLGTSCESCVQLPALRDQSSSSRSHCPSPSFF